MARHFIAEERTIVALDTTVLRDLCYEEPPWLAALGEMSRHRYEFCLADNVVAEIVAQLERTSITDAQYQLAMARVATFVSRLLPVLPGKFFLRCMIDALEDGEMFEPREVRVFSLASWDLLSKSKSLADLQEGIEYNDGPRSIRVSAKDNLADMALQEERDHWIAHLKQYDFLPKGELPKHSDDILAKMREAIDDKVNVEPKLSVRLDLALRQMQRQVEARTRTKDPYNPEAHKKRNDGIDFTLTFALMLPALLCTSDGTYCTTLRQLPSFQTPWVYKPDELTAAWSTKTVVRPLWP
jgi:hypothetical protein